MPSERFAFDCSVMLPLAHTNDMVPKASPVILVMSYDDEEDSSSDSEEDRDSDASSHHSRDDSDSCASSWDSDNDRKESYWYTLQTANTADRTPNSTDSSQPSPLSFSKVHKHKGFNITPGRAT